MQTNIPSGTVTFLFTDIEGSTRLLEILRDQYEALLFDHHRIFRTALPHWNGHEINIQGDSFFIAFPRAMDAIHYVVETQRSLADHAWPQGVQVKVRMGLHTGEPSLIQDGPVETPGAGGNQQTSYVGMDVHRAARIAAAGYGGQVLLSQTTRDLVFQDLPDGISLRELGWHILKDIRLPQRIYQLVIEGLPEDFPLLNSLTVQTEFSSFDDNLLPFTNTGDTRVEVQAYRSLLKQWRTQGIQTLDKASRAILLCAPSDLTFAQDDLAWLMRSSLQDGLELGPWLNRASSESEAVKAIKHLLEEYPKPLIRLELVRALCSIQGEQATEVLLQVTASDDSHEVRSLAAIEAARRNRLVDVQSILAAAAGKQDDPAGLSALVAVIDEFGSLPPGINYPRLPVAIELMRQRWSKGHAAIFARTRRTVIGGSLALAVLGSSIPLLAFLIYPSDFQRNTEFMSVAAWILSGALAGLVWGALQGFASGAALGLGDVLWSARLSPVGRFSIAGIAGLVFSVLMIVFTSAGLFSPTAGPGVYVPVFIIYGFIQGGALSWVIPRLGVQPPGRQLALNALKATLLIGLAALPAIYLVYQETTLGRLPIDWLYALLMPAGIALAQRSPRAGEENSSV
jgi:class 3 adenylate cyclase